MRKLSRSLWVTAICATVFGVIGVSSAGAKEFYAGKTLTMLVPSSAGGGLSVIIRAFAKVYTKHIPGNPTIVVKNMPGGGGTRSLNYLYSKAKPNGLTINFGSWNAAGVVSKRKGIRYVPEKFALIGAGAIPWITVVRSDLKPRISKATEIVKVAKFKIGGRSSDRSLDLVGNMSLQLIGANYKFIGGYRGMGKIKPALLAGEATGLEQAVAALQDDLLADGEVVVQVHLPANATPRRARRVGPQYAASRALPGTVRALKR